VESQATRALWALTMILVAEENLEAALAVKEVDQLKEKEHRERSAFLDMLSDVSRALFWSQAKVDIGFYEKVSVGLRTGWKMVKEKNNRSGTMAINLSSLLPFGGPFGGGGDEE